MASVCAAQEQPAPALKNADVITLANAGFSEGFIIDTINASRTEFDITPAGLGDLAQHAVSERIIRVMKEQSDAADRLVPVLPPSPEAPVSEALPAPAPLKAVALAIQNGASYYEWKSVAWGLWSRKVGVSHPMAASPSQRVAPHLGRMYSGDRPK